MSSVGIGSYAPPQAGAPYAGAGAVQSVMNGGGQLNGGAGFGMPGSYQPPPSLGSQQMSYMAPSAQSVVSETGSSLMTGSPVRGVLKKNVPPSAAFNHTAIALNRVSNTGWAGIGLFFERWKDKNHPIVVDIVHGGSAERDVCSPHPPCRTPACDTAHDEPLHPAQCACEARTLIAACWRAAAGLDQGGRAGGGNRRRVNREHDHGAAPHPAPPGGARCVRRADAPP